MGAGWLAPAAAGVDETALAGAEEEGKPEFSSGSASFSVSSPPDSVEEEEEEEEGTREPMALEAAPAMVP